MTTFADLQPGRVFWLGPDAGIQWSIRPICLQLIKADDKTSWDGNAYLDGYEMGVLDNRIVAVERRTCLVTAVVGVNPIRSESELAWRLGVAITTPPALVRRPTNTSPSIPRQRTNTPAAVRSTR